MLIFARSLKWMISESETDWAGAEKQITMLESKAHL